MDPELAVLIDDLAQAEIDALHKAYEIGLYAIKEMSATTVPAHPKACPAYANWSRFGVEPVCEDRDNPEDGCEEFLGTVKPGIGQCRCISVRRPKEQPMVALIALQKREKLPPPHTLN
jgi:hypothetical protein